MVEKGTHHKNKLFLVTVLNVFVSIFGRIQWWFVGKRLCRQSHYLKTSNGSHYEWILQIKFLHEIYRLSVFFYRKGIEKGIFHERFWKKNGAQQLPYVTFSLNCIILAISLSQGGQERYISA